MCLCVDVNLEGCARYFIAPGINTTYIHIQLRERQEEREREGGGDMLTMFVCVLTSIPTEVSHL